MKKTSVTSVGLTTTAATSTVTNEQQQSTLPQQLKVRLYHLFGQIEKEFELIYAENQRLQKQTDVTASRPNAESTDLNGSKNIFQGQNTSGSATPPKTLTKPVKPNKIQNNLFFQKFPKPLNARDIMQTIKSSQQQHKYDVKPYATIKGLRDGVWDVCCAKTPEQDLLVGTACADSTSSLWLVNSNNTEPVHMQQYCGHTGSVNSIRLHPKFLLHNNLVLTGSGDHQAHIWQYVDNGLGLSSDGDFGISGVPSTQQPTIANTMRMPICKFEGHTDACIAADWFPDCENIATASWDRTANIYNIESGKIIRTLQHDDQLTNVTLHPSSKIILTSSKDTTFKIWDLRDFVYSVNIYQGHTRSVNSAVFITDDKIATTSDDQTCKIWDLRIMRSCIVNINLNSSVNRLCTIDYDQQPILCLPLDNRDIKLYNMNGERLTRLPRNNRLGHRRLVTSCASVQNYLLSSSFDKQVICWSLDFKQNSKANDFVYASLTNPSSISKARSNEIALNTSLNRSDSLKKTQKENLVNQNIIKTQLVKSSGSSSASSSPTHQSVLIDKCPTSNIIKKESKDCAVRK